MLTSDVIATLISLTLQRYMAQDILNTKTVKLLMLETLYIFPKTWAYLWISKKKFFTSFTLKRHNVQNYVVINSTPISRKLHGSLHCTIISTEFLITQTETAKFIKIPHVLYRCTVLLDIKVLHSRTDTLIY